MIKKTVQHGSSTVLLILSMRKGPVHVDISKNKVAYLLHAALIISRYIYMNVDHLHSISISQPFKAVIVNNINITCLIIIISNTLCNAFYVILARFIWINSRIMCIE